MPSDTKTLPKITPLIRELDGTIYAYKCECGGAWKIYQNSYHNAGCPRKEVSVKCAKCGETRGKLIHKVGLIYSDPWLEGVDDVHEFVPPEFPTEPCADEIPSGVEEAHEGTTADKSEPEKLNNAQKAHFVSQFPEAVHKYDSRCDQCDAELDGWIPCDKCDIAVCSHKCLDAHKCPAVALAESSLSSPPPEFCQCDKDWTDGTGWCQECHLERKSNGEAE